MGNTVLVTDPATLHALFAQRLIMSAYARRAPDLNSRKRVIHTVRRKRPRTGAAEGEAEAEAEAEMPNASSTPGADPPAGAEAEAGRAAAASAKKVHRDKRSDKYREELRTKLDQGPLEDRKHDLDEFTAKVCLPLRLLPEEACTALEAGLVTLEALPGRVWIARLAPGQVPSTARSDEGSACDRASTAGGAEAARAGWRFPSTRFETLSFRVFQELWRRGWIITRGSNFGCDFLLYTSDPGTTHSVFSIMVTDGVTAHERTDPVKWSAIAALATKVRKAALLAYVDDGDAAVRFMLVEGCLFRRSDFLRGKALEEQALKEDAEAERRRLRRENPLLHMDASDDEEGQEASIAV